MQTIFDAKSSLLDLNAQGKIRILHAQLYGSGSSCQIESAELAIFGSAKFEILRAYGW